jgi:hypothetical protein
MVFSIAISGKEIWQFSSVQPKAFYASIIAIAAFCWIGAAVAFASGL